MLTIRFKFPFNGLEDGHYALEFVFVHHTHVDQIFEELSMGAYHTILECMATPHRKLDKEANNGGSMTHTHIITGTAVQIGERA